MTPLEFMAPGVCYALTMLAIWHFKGKRVHKNMNTKQRTYDE